MATIADELNAISVEHGYTGPAPKTIAGAIDALADTLAGADVEERRTIADAVKALAPYIGSGGGGEGVVLGSMQYVPALTSDVPVVGEGYNAIHMNVYSINVGEQKVVDSGDNVNSVNLIASGASCTLCTELGGKEVTLDDISVSAYVITKKLVNNDYVYTSVAPWDGEFVLSILGRLDGSPYLLISYTVPELSDGELLMVLDAPGDDES